MHSVDISKYIFSLEIWNFKDNTLEKQQTTSILQSSLTWLWTWSAAQNPRSLRTSLLFFFGDGLKGDDLFPAEAKYRSHIKKAI